MQPRDDRMPVDEFCGMGSIPFPSLMGGKIERGVWCLGCAVTVEAIDFEDQQQVERALHRNIDIDLINVKQIFRGLEHRAMSKSEFFAHAKHCLGVQKLTLSEWRLLSFNA